MHAVGKTMFPNPYILMLYIIWLSGNKQNENSFFPTLPRSSQQLTWQITNDNSSCFRAIINKINLISKF
jgi:hypothetical protein